MSNEEVMSEVVEMVTDMFTYLLPIVGFLAGTFFVVSFLMYLLFGQTRKFFRD